MGERRLMDLRRMVNDSETPWCELGIEYFERYIAGNNITTLADAMEYIKADTDYDERITALCVELDVEDTFDAVGMSKKNTLTLLRKMLKDEIILERVCDFESLDEYRLHVGSTMVGKGSLDTINEISLVQYDETKWWFAKGVDDTVLNNAQEVEDYLNSVVRERKYIDVGDNIIQWKPA
jgi:hypothetical protein